MPLTELEYEIIKKSIEDVRDSVKEIHELFDNWDKIAVKKLNESVDFDELAAELATKLIEVLTEHFNAVEREELP